MDELDSQCQGMDDKDKWIRGDQFRGGLSSDREVLNILFGKKKKLLKIKRKSDATRKNLTTRNTALKAAKSISAMYRSKSAASNLTTRNTALKATKSISAMYRSKSAASKQAKSLRAKSKTEALYTGVKDDAMCSSEGQCSLESKSCDGNDPKPATHANITQVKPFKFMTEERLQRKGRIQSNDHVYVSTAEYIENFQKSTPPRFRTKIPDDISNSLPNANNTKNYHKELTRPISPKLKTLDRCRPVTALSQDEIEKRTMEEIKRHPFKATPFNSKLFQSGGAIGIRKPVIQPTTEPISPRFTKRKSTFKRNYEEMEREEEKREFKAMPMPHNIFAKVTGVPEKQTLEPTVACSPKLSKRRKVVKDATVTLEEETKRGKYHVTESKPLETMISVEPLTETSNIILDTASRNKEKLKFSEMNEQRLAAEEKRKLKELEEEENIKLFRQSLVHKARPIQNYPGINIKKSTKPLTKAISPVHHYKTRSSKFHV